LLLLLLLLVVVVVVLLLRFAQSTITPEDTPQPNQTCWKSTITTPGRLQAP
jgi:hypothetical protein